jgi:hypothetical protein
MGWLFKDKKSSVEPKKNFDSNSLRFPDKIDTERVIKPANLQKAVSELKSAANDFKNDEFSFNEPAVDEPRFVVNKPLPEHVEYDNQEDVVFKEQERNYVFVKKDIYQKILGDMKSINDVSKTTISINKRLSLYETHENKQFKELKRFVNGLHNDFLKIDRLLFKN